MNDVQLHPLPVVETRPAAKGQLTLVLQAAGSPVAAAHEHPGQYVLVKLGDDVARPFALSTPPGVEKIELLLKLTPERAAWTAALTREDRVPVSKPRGPGFPLARADGRALWLVGTGSGIAPLRAVLEAVLQDRRKVDEVHVLYGVRKADELAYTHRFGAWAGAGVHVVPVVSRPEPGTWDGPVGRVQDHLPKSFDRPKEAWFFLAGLPEMDREVAAALVARGVGAEQIFRNY